MKDYKTLMQEAISARRLKELEAKGKGAQAAAKMAADGLKGDKYKTGKDTFNNRKSLGVEGKKGGGLTTTKTKGFGSNNTQEKSNVGSNRKRTPATGASPDDQNTSTATSRKARRAEVRKNKIDKIKHERGQRLKQRASWVRDRIVGKGSGTIGTTGGGNSSDPSVRYQ